ncbi:hypothetical protein [Arthrobacter sp. ISL-95]|uniref:hypothetical protein n=1 Tax=Arthrobacter sp. ISL-95 TaxID=2819116 RepID=UPI001BE7D1FF|nr:hypothetical protein [Arthrobacter sp. ISL-95]MBT2585543.1 hypothetical protein [Arthrobacter sp. ISL-95]
MPQLSIGSLPGASLLTAFGVLGALVFAVYIAARSLPKTEKEARPDSTFLLSRLAALCLHASTGLFILTAVDMFYISHRVDVLRLAGSAFFAFLLAYPSAEAQILTDQLSNAHRKEARREVDIQKTRAVLRRLPGHRPTLGNTIGQAFVATLAFPSVISAVVWLSTGKPKLATLTLISALFMTVVAFLSLQHHLHSVYRSVSADIGMFSAFKTLMLISLALSAITVAPTDVDVWAYFVIVGLAVVLVPFWILVIFCVPLPRTCARGLVLHSVARTEERRLRRLEKESASPKPKVNELALLSLTSFAPAPFGLVTALAASRDIKASGERGKRIVYTVYITTAVVLGALVTLLIALPTVVANLK